MKKLLWLVIVATLSSSLDAYMIRFINSTGSPLTGNVVVVGGKKYPINQLGVADTKTDCFVGANVSAGGRSGSVLSEKNFVGIQMTCGSLTYEVKVDGNKLSVRKQ